VCNLYSITTSQAAIAGLFRRMNRYVGNLPPMPGVFPDYPAPVIRNAGDAEEIILMRWGMPPPRIVGPPVTNIRNTPASRALRGAAGADLVGELGKAGRPLPPHGRPMLIPRSSMSGPLKEGER
jgi:hypothetical protein